MQFDIFHSLARVDSVRPKLSDSQCLANFIKQVKLAEQLNFDTFWVAESHFSSELQKENADPVIPNFQGEVGLNCDSMQLIQYLIGQTKRLNFGTAIHNIVGGNGGPIASADRINMLRTLNYFNNAPRQLHIGVAAGRFPYINSPFGIVPRNQVETENWSSYKRVIFLEALEIVLRLLNGEIISSDSLNEYKKVLPQFKNFEYNPRWTFEPLRLVPIPDARNEHLHIVLGSHDPLAQDIALNICDVDLFNLSFTKPEDIELLHLKLDQKIQQMPRRSSWHRGRLPRTVLVFIDKNANYAQKKAETCFDTYIEAMRGTVQLPPREELMARALIGNPEMIYEQLSPGGSHGFDKNDRLMLWFEFNQNDHDAVAQQMQLFAEEVMAKCS